MREPASRSSSSITRAGRLGLQTQTVGESAILTSLQPDLERARSEHALRHFDAVPELLNRVIANAEACSQSSAAAEDVRGSFELLLGSAHCVLARSLFGQDRSLQAAHGNEPMSERAAAHFARSLQFFENHKDRIGTQRNACRLWADYGIALYYAGAERRDDAVRTLKRAEETGVTPPEALHYLARAYRDLADAGGDRAELLPLAKRALDKGVLLSPGDPGIYLTFGEVLERMGKTADAVDKYVDAALAVAASHELGLAAHVLRRALSLAPARPAAVGLAVEVQLMLGNFSAAIEIVDRTLELEPQAPWALAIKGKALRASGYSEDAVACLRQVKVNNADWAWVLSELAAALIDSGKPDEAAKHLHEALKWSPEDPVALFLNGRLAMERGDTKEAIEAFQSALRAQPEFLDASYQLGRAQLAEGNYAQAIEAFDKVIAVDPKWIDAAEEKAEALYLKGDLEAALSQSRRTLELNPGNVRMLELAYVALRDLNRDEDALRELDLELSRNPNSALAWYLKGAILLDRDERELAKESLERARQLDPDNPDVQIALSNALRLLGQYLEAGAWCESALNREGLSSYALRWAGVYFSEVGDFSRACKILSEAVRLYEDDPWLWSGYGWALQYRDDRSAGESVKAYEKALAALADEYSMWAKKGLADALFVAGQEEEASHRFRQVIEQWPDQSDRDVAYVHGWSHYRLGNYQQAAELLKCVAESSPDYLYARFDCGLARAAEGMLLEARQTYRRAIAEALSVHPLRRHGLLYVAQFDLVEAAKKNRLTHDAADLIEEVSRQLHSAGNLMTDEWLRSPWARRANT